LDDIWTVRVSNGTLNIEENKLNAANDAFYGEETALAA